MKILIADDHTIVREGLKQILKKIDPAFLIEESGNGDEVLNLLEYTNYDLAILDISMPGKSGFDILKSLKDKNIDRKILVLSIHPQDQYAIRVLKLGASGYLCKDSIYEELTFAIKTILAGKKYMPPELVERFVLNKKDTFNSVPHERLSEREFQIMRLLAKGNSVKEIAAYLFISDKTVSTHRVRLLEKMGMRKNAELISYAIKNELIE